MVISSTLAYAISMFVGFGAQKYWTFQDTDKKTIIQLSKYVSLGIFNIGVNALFMHLMVNISGLHYLIAQLVSIAVITLWSLFFYKKFVFRESALEYKPPVLE